MKQAMDTWEWTIFRGLMEKPFCNVSAPFFTCRDKTDVSKYICQQLDNATIVKQAGELNGQAFHIESCNVS